MNDDEIRIASSLEAIKLIKGNKLIGLGEGRGVIALIEQIKAQGILIKVVTPSKKTVQKCFENNIEVIPTSDVTKIPITFDGCGVVDKNFIALKSGAGIHTEEKLVASMSDDYVLIVNEQKYLNSLEKNSKICIDILKISLFYVQNQIEILGGISIVRNNENLNSNCNRLLLDAWFPTIDNFNELNKKIEKIVGVISTSIFVNEPTKIILGGKSEIKILTKNKIEVA